MTKPPNSIVLTCYAPPELAQWISEQAHRMDMSKSHLIRQILDEARASGDMP